MKKPNIKTSQKVVPMIYAYTTPEIERHNGWTKIGYTEKDVEERIKEQTHTADIKWDLEWKGTAIFDDGTGDSFRDTDFHSYLRKKEYAQDESENNEWFEITGEESHKEFIEFKSNRGLIESAKKAIEYKLRIEQEDAVSKTVEYFKMHEEGEFLWNAKPRFGKTLSTYDLIKSIDAQKVLIVTNRPAIANSWFEDYEKFLGQESGYSFVSDVDALKDRVGVLTREEYVHSILNDGNENLIQFVSLQDIKGSIYFGGKHDKLKELSKKDGMLWDLLVIDEAHEGVDTYKTDVAFDQINRKNTLHLSGTPFKALANSKFDDDAIFNWTYADEQKRKREFDQHKEIDNPYEDLPMLNMYTYQMSEIVKDELQQGIEIQGETVEYAFDLNEFFATQNGRFIHNSSVDKFLDALTCQEKFPFSTDELRSELNHTFWLLDRVDSARALARKLNEHPVFKDYEIVLAAGDGKIDDDDANEESYDKVVKAISENEKTITLSVGQLTTGITIPEWTAVLMLSNVQSPSLYMQAAFRAQNPCLFNSGTEQFRKENAYVFDFDPARTLVIFEEFANDLSPNTSAGRGDMETRKDNVRQLLNFFPVIGEDEEGKLIELNAEQVLIIPRKIKSVEVVRRGFMSNFLFQNITNIFSAPEQVKEILEKLEPIEEPKVRLTREVREELSLDENGDVSLSDEYIIGKEQDVFGDKLYDISDMLYSDVDATKDGDAIDISTKLKQTINENFVDNIMDDVEQAYGDDLKRKDKKQLESVITYKVDREVDKTVMEYKIQDNLLNKEREEELKNRFETGKSTEDIEKEYQIKKNNNIDMLKETINSVVDDLKDESKKEVVKTVETNLKERERDDIETGIRDHLRGFARTIPSFLMAYGDETVTLATFDSIVPEKVFLEVTSITLEQFRFLRDGGTYIDEEDGEEKVFPGKLFDPVVFDDSVKEFLGLKRRLSDYFDEKSIEDIFDYIPPQKTNQIYTPKDVVTKMVDMLEEENPGCFDDPEKTFIDPYMKSGLYITEIVKRLYQSSKMKEKYPNKEDRLKHIFEKQVYGLAPTEIIYKIATSYILGFDEDVLIEKHNFKQVDALPYAKKGTLKEKIDELFPDKE